VALIWSISAARVVDLPLPVAPVTSTNPSFAAAMVFSTSGNCNCSIVGILVPIVRKTIPGRLR
jgi:hypothetical protein